MSPTRAARRAVWAAAAALAGCAVGPDFHAPDAPAATRYTAQAPVRETASVAELAAGAAQRLVDGREPAPRWWTAFGSSELDALVDAALRANPDLQAADAALRAAQESALAQRAAFFPSVDAHYLPSRQSIAGPVASGLASNASVYTLHTLQLDVGYSVDVFGGTRRQFESAQAQAEAQRFQRDAAYLTLTANVVLAAVQEASLRGQIDATNALIDAAVRQLDAVRRQRAAGVAGAADEAAQEAVVAQARAGLPALEKQLAQQRDLLAVLAGRAPADESAPRFDIATLVLPRELPLSLPSRLVAQRPDIRAAQAQLHAASAQIGVATAARLPSLTLSASLGSTAETLGTLLKPGGAFWTLGADLAQPIFDGGALRHRQRAAEANYAQAAAQYRSTVLTAFQNVADTLHAIDADARTLVATAASEQAARRSVAIAERQWRAGDVAYPVVLTARQAQAQARLALVQAQAARLADSVALYQALGGGWEHDAGDAAP